MSKQRQYALLAKALFYPTPELIDTVEAGLYNEEFGSVPVPDSLEDLEVEYCRLFVGPGHVEVPPYESVYHGHDINMQQGLVMGPVTMEVKEHYYEAGLQLTVEFSDMPDHIAVETLFLAYLETQLKSMSDGNFLRQKHHFLITHLGKWVEPFADAVKEKGRQPWYVFISEELKKTVQDELKTICCQE